MKIESAKITIKGKEYKFLKPSAVDVIEIEDRCIGTDGTLDDFKYAEQMIAMVSRDINVADLVEFNNAPIELSSGETITIPEIGFVEWNNKIKSIAEFSRIKLAKLALVATGVTGEINLRGFKYEDIDKLAMAFFMLYDSSELRRVVDEISTFCM